MLGSVPWIIHDSFILNHYPFLYDTTYVVETAYFHLTALLAAIVFYSQREAFTQRI
jgi:hypothetical protein